MSSVQLSVSSPGAAGFGVPQRARRAVCRSLFGPVDHDELNRDVEAKLREISERDQERWNFNFGSGTPLAGDYEWEGAAVEATPEFYQESVQVGKRRAVAAAAAAVHVKARTEAPNRENDAARGAAAAAVPPETARAGTPMMMMRMKKTSRVTDFYVKRRKHGDVKERERVSQEKPFSSPSCEQTPRKRLR